MKLLDRTEPETIIMTPSGVTRLRYRVWLLGNPIFGWSCFPFATEREARDYAKSMMKPPYQHIIIAQDIEEYKTFGAGQ